MIGHLAKRWIGVAAMTLVLAGPLSAQTVTPFMQSLAEAAADEPALSKFYRETRYAPLWTGDDRPDRARRAALIEAFAQAELHGLPPLNYDPETLRTILAAARTPSERARADVALSRAYLAYASDLATGILDPSTVVPGIKRRPVRRDDAHLLRAIAGPQPRQALARLAPQSPEYRRLLGEKRKLEDVIARGGWNAPVPAGHLEPGSEGPDVAVLRDRLISMGYLAPTVRLRYDAAVRRAVETFQKDHGLVSDGIVGAATRTALNIAASDRLGQIIVAMERERWLPRDLGARHIWVNLTDFTAKIVDGGKVTFATRSVIGKNAEDRETPEFSDSMDHMVINPTWYVPRSITVNEYLPDLRQNPWAHGQLEIVDRRGTPVNRARGFAQYSAANFPFSMRQPPGERNALGRVKFMFPNKYNIYLHDTPAKGLFSQPVRAYSHGCIRLSDPTGFARALLAAQTDDPGTFYERRLRSGRETRVSLDVPVPVHLVYRTAIAKPAGGMSYRADIYGRDAALLAALGRAGVVLGEIGS
ncbi:murein L,D-transpeptidase YcbB/YkuD [Palleronia aestuarii]|uniref:Murein L,D-transpeptidase YcbB/YkuD n=1 Tax=Palleronia aestuarii TaxID=568105 RepID=A0A2W7Q9T3_9RHOB|nr:L,D-transpeptidase family protein [Palleronia aestuarii]PZX18489.1 murein L,D-transpeptidase YcbB/YkuD [Palleronia aestuarii]